MNILALDTTTRFLSIALKTDSKVISWQKDCGNQASRYIFVGINNLLKKKSIKPGDVDLLAVNTGPGSFTGIRIGLTLAKVWAQIFAKEIYPLDSFSILRRQAQKLISPDFDYLAVVIPSIKGEWFRAIYRPHSRIIKSPRVVKEKVLFSEIQRLGPKIWLTGPEPITGLEVKFIPDFPRAETLIELTARSKNYIPADQLQPTYFRPSLAEECWTKR